jgi:hypothetical protein
MVCKIEVEKSKGSKGENIGIAIRRKHVLFLKGNGEEECDFRIIVLECYLSVGRGMYDQWLGSRAATGAFGLVPPSFVTVNSVDFSNCQD